MTVPDIFLENGAVPWWTAMAVVIALAVASLIWRGLRTTEKIGESMYREQVARIRTWLIIVPAVLIPVALGPLGLRSATVILALLCAWEFSRASGLGGTPWLGRVSIVMAAVFASGSIPGHLAGAALSGGFVLLAFVGLISCDPGQFLRQVSLSAVAVAWFGICLGTLGDIATRDGGVLLVLWLVVCVELNDVIAFMGGKLFKGRKLCPSLSPGKTISGAVTALLATTAFAGATAHWYWEPAAPWVPFALGFVISAAGQSGDLVISAVKRSLEIKDIGSLLPGHGGVLDRCDSLLLASPITLFLVSVYPVLPH